jgi:hypothetical protein
MSDTLLSLAQLVTINDSRNADINVSDILNKSPVLNALAADSAKETTYYYTKYTTAPVAGFRTINDGTEITASADTQISVALKLLSCNVRVDKALADHYNKGGAEAYLRMETARALQQAMFIAERQFFYGTVSPGSSAGFSGLANQTDLDGKTDAMVVDAGGSTSITGSSVFAIRTANDASGIVLGYGGNISIGNAFETYLSGTTGSFPAYGVPVEAYMGARRGGTYDVARLCNLTADSGKTLTDAKIADLLALFPAGQMPTFLAMNRRSLKQLQASRTATNSTGAPAPFPTEAFGIPIILTDAIVSTEALLT